MNSMALDAANPNTVYLMPGDFYFGEHPARIQTLLGSCVSITAWHPLLRIGGMSHSMLPTRGKPGVHSLDGRYGDESLALLLDEIHNRRTRPEEYQVKIFGGGNMFQQTRAERAFNVAERNVEAVRALLEGHGFTIQAAHVGGKGHRVIIFDLSDGNVWVKHEEIQMTD